MADYVISTEIDSSGAVRGEKEVVAAIRSIDRASKDLRREFNALATSLRETLGLAGLIGGSLQGIGTGLRAAAAEMREAAEAMARAQRSQGGGAGGGGSPRASGAGGIASAATAAGVSGLSADIKAAAAQMAGTQQVMAQVLKAAAQTVASPSAIAQEVSRNLVAHAEQARAQRLASRDEIASNQPGTLGSQARNIFGSRSSVAGVRNLIEGSSASKLAEQKAKEIARAEKEAAEAAAKAAQAETNRFTEALDSVRKMMGLRSTEEARAAKQAAAEKKAEDARIAAAKREADMKDREAAKEAARQQRDAERRFEQIRKEAEAENRNRDAAAKRSASDEQRRADQIRKEAEAENRARDNAARKAAAEEQRRMAQVQKEAEAENRARERAIEQARRAQQKAFEDARKASERQAREEQRAREQAQRAAERQERQAAQMAERAARANAARSFGGRNFFGGLNNLSAGLQQMTQVGANAGALRSVFNATGGSIRAMFGAIQAGAGATVASLRAVGGAISSLGTMLRRATLGFGSFFAAFATIQAIKGLASVTDDFTNMERQLRVATTVMKDFKTGQKDFAESEKRYKDSMAAIFQISQENRSELVQTGAAFARFARTTQSVGTNVKDTADFVASLTAGLQASGATASETSSVMIQLSQAFSKGILNDDEMKSFSENAGVVIQVLERSFGQAWGKISLELREGKRNLRDFFVAIANARPVMQELLNSMPRTIESALVQLKNSWIKTINELSKETGFQDRMVAAIDAVRSRLEGADVKAALKSIMDGVAGIANGFVDWLTHAESFTRMLDRIGTKLSFVGDQIKFKLNPFASGKSPFEAIDAINSARFARTSRSPFGQAYNGPGTPNSDQVAADMGFPAIRSQLSTLGKEEIPLRFNDDAIKDRARSLFADIASRAEEVSRIVASLPDQAVSADIQAKRKEMDLLVIKAREIQEQISSGNLTPAAVAAMGPTVVDLRAKLEELAPPIRNAKTEMELLQAANARVITTATARPFNPEAAAQAVADLAKIKKDIDAAPGGLAGAEVRTNEIAAAVAALEQQVTKLAVALAQAQGLSTGIAAGTGVQPAGSAKPLNDKRENIKPFTPVKPAKDDGKKAAEERLARLKEETKLINAEVTGNTKLVREAQISLEIERNVTAELRKQHPEIAKAIEEEVKRKHAAEETRKVYERFRGLGEQLGETLSDTFIEIGKGTKTAKEAMKEMLAKMIEMTVRALILKPVIEAMGRGMGSMGASLFPGDSGIGSFVANGFTFANGAAFSGGSVVPFATGGVTTGPMTFPMANGRTGLMGERGPEAIMPLTRTPSGGLGVRAMGGGGYTDNRVFQVHVAGDMTDETWNKVSAHAEMVYAKRERQTIAKAKSAVARENRDNKGYLSR